MGPGRDLIPDQLDQVAMAGLAVQGVTAQPSPRRLLD
jgi:hypothetical protein